MIPWRSIFKSLAEKHNWGPETILKMNLIQLRIYLTPLDESGQTVKRTPAAARALKAKREKERADFVERLKGSIRYGW